MENWWSEAKAPNPSALGVMHYGMLQSLQNNRLCQVSASCDARSAHHTRALFVELPARAQVLHGLRTIVCTHTVFQAQLVRFFDLGHVQLNAKPYQGEFVFFDRGRGFERQVRSKFR